MGREGWTLVRTAGNWWMLVEVKVEVEVDGTCSVGGPEGPSTSTVQ
jgi:hypothetical protein